ncbi:MAG TPA: hypothetical protein VLG28_15240 [Acidimicrobiia bacterium]|nr:hypothetical protein [Acidimicrobiia bacterium]
MRTHGEGPELGDGGKLVGVEVDGVPPAADQRLAGVIHEAADVERFAGVIGEQPDLGRHQPQVVVRAEVARPGGVRDQPAVDVGHTERHFPQE